MKSMDDYTAAVLRRSQEKIAARRKARRCLLAGVIPLCLALCVWLAIPSRHPETSNGTASTDDAEIGSAVEYTALTITNNAAEFAFTLSDPKAIARAHKALTQYLTAEAPENTDGGTNVNGAPLTVYTIRFSTPEEETCIYYLFLDSRTLVSDNGLYASLTNEQWKHLQTLFAIPDTNQKGE